MKNFLFVFGAVLLIHSVVGPPPKKRLEDKVAETNEIPDADKEAKPVKEYEAAEEFKENVYPESVDNIDELKLEYERYMTQVVSLLETDPEFKKKVEKVDEKDVQSGRIAKELEFVDHNVRTKLDELKRSEIERLRQLAHKAYIQSNGSAVHKLPEHLDHSNPHSFEVADLQALILKASKDLAEIDKKRKEMFVEYEMKKELEEKEKLSHMSEEDKKKFLDQQKAEEKKHHEQNKQLHHPGSQKQIEEVWEEQDHMTRENFNPRTFFMMHDLNGDMFWDEEEVKVLFLREVEKIHKDDPSPDSVVKNEDLERMREHYFKEVDKNQDRLISLEEFIVSTQQTEYRQDDGWKPVNEQQLYSQEDLRQYEQQQIHIQQLIAEGKMLRATATAPSICYITECMAQRDRLPPEAAYQYHGLSPPPHGYQYQYDPNAVPSHHAPQYQAHPQQYPAGAHPQQYQAGAHPQQYQAGAHPQQYQAGAHPQQYQAGAHSQQYQAGAHPQQYQAGAHPQQYPNGGHPQQYQAAGHAPQFQPAVQAPQYQAGAHAQQYQAGPQANAQQYQGASQTQQQNHQSVDQTAHHNQQPVAGQQNQQVPVAQNTGNQGYRVQESVQQQPQSGNAKIDSVNAAPVNSQSQNNQQPPVAQGNQQQYSNDNTISKGSAPANNIQDGGFKSQNIYQTGNQGHSDQTQFKSQPAHDSFNSNNHL